MKKALLFGLMLIGASAAYAGEVQQDESCMQAQTIPTPEGSYLDFSKGYCYYAGTDGNKVVDGTALGNMRPGSHVVLKLDNTETNNGYTLTFQGGNKNEGGILAISFYTTNPVNDEFATPIFSQDVTIQAMGNWSDKLPYTVTIPSSIPVGDVYMKLMASRSNSVAYAGNFDQFQLTAIKSEVNYYTLTTTATPAEGGVISGNTAEQYAQGTPVTLTATANPGYKFVKWEVGTSETAENPLSLTIEADTEVVAVFEEIGNALNPDLTFDLAAAYATSGSISIDTSGDAPVIGSVKNGASVIYKFSVAESGSYNVVAHWTNKYDATITMNISTDPESFSDQTAVAVDMAATGGWDNFVEAKWNSFDLESGVTYYLKMSFATSSGWAGNTNYLALEHNGENGISDIAGEQPSSLRYYNLQGVEIDPENAHGVIINSRGVKIYKK